MSSTESSSSTSEPSAKATPFPTTIAGKLECATKLKDEGNELFKIMNYKKALL